MFGKTHNLTAKIALVYADFVHITEHQYVRQSASIRDLHAESIPLSRTA